MTKQPITRSAYLATVAAHLKIAEAYRSVGKIADANAAYAAADACARKAERMLPKSQRVA
jgi:hypothetical protein